MIVVNCKQGTQEWLAARSGVVTASGLDRIVTPGKRQPSKQAGPYMAKLVTEVLLGRPIEEEGSSPWMTRGLEMEADAVGWYAFEKGVEPEEVGFLLRDDRRVGCSPDRLVGTDGGLEIKTPSAHVHVANLLDPEKFEAEHFTQVQTGLWVSGRLWWDLVSYNPEIPPLVRRIEPDAKWQADIGPIVTDFLAAMDEAVAKIREMVNADPNPLGLWA